MIQYTHVINIVGDNTMQYCLYTSDSTTLMNISNILNTPQQQSVFIRYQKDIQDKKHPISFVEYYRNHIEKYNLEPDVNFEMLEILKLSQPCSNFAN